MIQALASVNHRHIVVSASVSRGLYQSQRSIANGYPLTTELQYFSRAQGTIQSVGTEQPLVVRLKHKSGELWSCEIMTVTKRVPQHMMPVLG